MTDAVDGVEARSVLNGAESGGIAKEAEPIIQTDDPNGLNMPKSTDPSSAVITGDHLQTEGRSSESPTTLPVVPISTDESPSPIFPVLIIIIVLLLIARKIYQSRRDEAQRRVPTHEELRRLREAHLGSYMATANENRTTIRNEKETVHDDKLSTMVKAQIAEVRPEEPQAKETMTKKESGRIRYSRALLKRRLPPRKWEPLRTVEELLNWSPSPEIRSLDQQVPLSTRRSPSSKLLMVCHDMAGNYAEDAFMDGWYSHSVSKDSWVWGFRPCHFAYTEAFVYFAHAFVSIPPRGWIDAAHRHGTKVFGTFITEWEAGQNLCEQVFASDESTLEAADKLTAIRQAFGFEGWLINIENRLSVSIIPNVLKFLDALSSKGSMVVWYDSVVSDTGELKWQNGLNERNLKFFLKANCGTLTNYGWVEERVQMSNELANAQPGKSAKQVWHGIDVFGRGTFGNGGMHCDLALNLLDKYNSPSACLFAPGWALESAAERNPFLGKSKSLEFWDKILRNTAWGEMESACFSVRQDVTKHALFTDFCDGGGASFWAAGEKLSQFPWLDLRRQTLQPRWDVITPDEAEDPSNKTQKRVTIRCVDTSPVFSGSSAIQLVGRRFGATNESWFFFPVISCDARLGGDKGPGSKLKIKAAILPLNGDIALCLDIAPRDPNKPVSRLKLVPRMYEVEDTLPAVEESVERGGWTVRTWELRTNDLRGRSLVAVGVSPLPVSSSVGTSWMDTRLGMLSLDETSVDCSKCRPGDVSLDSDTLRLRWSCLQCKDHNSGTNVCAMESVLVFVNGKFRQCAFARECQMNELTVLPNGKIDEVITLKGMRWDGSLSEAARLNQT